MQNMEQTNSEIRELTRADPEAISAGNILGDTGRWVVRHLKGDGDLRHSTDRPT
jgi:hypothetical protein